MSWGGRYKIYKTSNPNLIITAVCAFPNVYNTLEKVIDYYGVKALQKDPLLLDIHSEYEHASGRSFIPLYFADDCPKLARLQELTPVGKSFFWCIAYTNPHVETIRRDAAFMYRQPSHQWFKTRFLYWLENFHFEGSNITTHLFRSTVDTWMYEQTAHFSDKEKSRRFQLTANSYLVHECKEPKDYIDFVDQMYKTDIYRFMFEAYKNTR